MLETSLAPLLASGQSKGVRMYGQVRGGVSGKMQEGMWDLQRVLRAPPALHPFSPSPSTLFPPPPPFHTSYPATAVRLSATVVPKVFLDDLPSPLRPPSPHTFSPSCGSAPVSNGCPQGAPGRPPGLCVRRPHAVLDADHIR